MKLLIRLLTVTFTFALSKFAHAEDLRVVDIRRNIPLADTEKVYKDFYINAGPAEGMKKGQILTVKRKMSVRDSSGATNVGEIIIPVGELKIIAVYDKVTVARLSKLLERDDLPMLEQTAVMTGDLVESKK